MWSDRLGEEGGQGSNFYYFRRIKPEADNLSSLTAITPALLQKKKRKRPQQKLWKSITVSHRNISHGETNRSQLHCILLFQTKRNIHISNWYDEDLIWLFLSLWVLFIPEVEDKEKKCTDQRSKTNLYKAWASGKRLKQELETALDRTLFFFQVQVASNYKAIKQRLHLEVKATWARDTAAFFSVNIWYHHSW